MEQIELITVEKQAKRWNFLAFFLPGSFITLTISLYWINVLGFDDLFFAGLILWGIVSVTWWFWTMFTIIFLTRLLIKTSNDLEDIKQEVIQTRKEFN